MKKHLTIMSIVLTLFSFSQEESEKLPYYEIPETPDIYTAGAIAARMVDGLGFRYYWATEGLRENDLKYRPSEEARNTAETIDHIYGLSLVIVNTTLKKINDRTIELPELDYSEKRKQTLLNIATAANILRKSSSTEMKNFNLIFKSNKGESQFPFWNNINGPIADAIWHSGQIVSFRRASGNPFNSNVSLLRGKLRN